MSARKRPPKPPHARHDHGYKRLFSHPQAVAELIRGFLRPDWVERLDLSTLERVGNELISDDLRERQSDVVWRMRWKDESEAWLYLLLEFQSTSDPFMAVRLLTYTGLLLEEILRKEKLKPGAGIPVVLPVVLYNGKRPWRAPLDLTSLCVKTPGSLRRHLPRLCYLLLDEGRLDLDRPELARSWMAALFRIETCKRPSDLPRLTHELARLLPGEEPELRRTIKIWLRAVLRRTFPGVTIPRMIDLEDTPMLEEMALEWRKKYRKEDLQEGMRQILLQLLERRFGPLPEEKRSRVEAITSPARLKRLADKILTAKSLQELGI
ncbi:MAG TPA: Rpn family recombination-promoting nuclease/putative transposase [Thermoanaerobaculia bacterium]